MDEVKAKDNNIHNTNNYLQTYRDILNIARIQIDEELDTIILNRFSHRGQETDRGRGNRSYRERKGGRYNAKINRAQFSNTNQIRSQRN